MEIAKPAADNPSGPVRPIGSPKILRTYIDAAIFFAILGLIWEYSVEIFEIKPYLLPKLSAVFFSLFESSALLWKHTLITLWEVVIGFAAAVVFGIAIAAGVFFVPIARRTVYPLVVAIQGVPKVALAPLIIVWFGYGLSSKVVMVFLFSVFPIVISTLGGLSSTPENLIEHFKALRAPPWFTFMRLRVPSALPSFVDGCKVAIPLAVIGAVVGEFVGSADGLGNLILAATSSARTELVFASIIMVTLLSLILFAGAEILGKLVWWRAK